jgi:sugar phosphate isomerase/epimerase
MAVKRITVHCLEIEDKPGSLQKLLADAASANVDLLCFAAFSAGGGRGRVYVSGKDPDALKACAQEAGIEAAAAAGFIVSGDDRVGAAAESLKGLVEAGINGVAGAAMVCDGRYQMLIVVDAADGGAAEKALGA